MVNFGYSALALLALRAIGAHAADPVSSVSTSTSTVVVEEKPTQLPNLDVSVAVSFPEVEVFGVKLINGRPTKALLEFTNNEKAPVSIALIGGQLASTKPVAASSAIVRNITSTRYDVEIPASEKKILTYSFTTDLHPQDLRLSLVAVVTSATHEAYQIQAFNGTVSVVEAATSFFDPQIIFLYLVLLAGLGGTLYFVYKTWIEALFPQTKRGGKGGERAKRSSGGSKKAVDPADQVAVIGADGPAVTTGALAQQAYNEDWIPDHHINRPAARRVKSGASARKTRVVE